MSPLNCPYSKSIIQIMTNDKTDRIINRILEVDNFQNVACFCDNFAEFVQELAEWGGDGCAKVDFDDADLDIAKLDRFIKAENGYIREAA